MQFTSLTTLAFADIPTEKMTRANTFLSTVQQMTMGMGVGVGAVLLHLAALLHGRHASALAVADFHLELDAGSMVSGHQSGGAPYARQPSSN